MHIRSRPPDSRRDHTAPKIVDQVAPLTDNFIQLHILFLFGSSRFIGLFGITIYVHQPLLILKASQLTLLTIVAKGYTNCSRVSGREML